MAGNFTFPHATADKIILIGFLWPQWKYCTRSMTLYNRHEFLKRHFKIRVR